MVQKIATSLIESGKIERGFMGVSIADLSNDLKELYENKQGAVILMIEKTRLQKGGLQVSDLILEVDGVKIKNSNELKNTVASIALGRTITITYERDKKSKNNQIKLAKMDAERTSRCQ